MNDWGGWNRVCLDGAMNSCVVRAGLTGELLLFNVTATFHDSVCIRQWDWSETSQTVSLLTREMGIVRGIAKGSKRPTDVFSGGIEMLTRGQAGIIVKKNAELALITAWDLTQTFRVLRTWLAAHYAGVYFADLTNQFVRDHDPHPRLFDALVAGLEMLRPGEPIWASVSGFQWAVLVEGGFRPAIDHDARTGEEMKDHATYSFVPLAGGLVGGGPSGSGEAREVEAREDGAIWRVRRETIEYLRGLDRAHAGSAATDENSRRTGDARTPERAARLLGAYLRHVLGFEMPTHVSVFGVDRHARGGRMGT